LVWQASSRVTNFIEYSRMDTASAAAFIIKWLRIVQDTCAYERKSWNAVCNSADILKLTLVGGFGANPSTPSEKRAHQSMIRSESGGHLKVGSPPPPLLCFISPEPLPSFPSPQLRVSPPVFLTGPPHLRVWV
jgi:hypothetical protein